MSSLTGAFILDFQKNMPTTSIESSSYHISCSSTAHYALVHLILYFFSFEISKLIHENPSQILYPPKSIHHLLSVKPVYNLLSMKNLFTPVFSIMAMRISKKQLSTQNYQPYSYTSKAISQPYVHKDHVHTRPLQINISPICISDIHNISVNMISYP